MNTIVGIDLGTTKSCLAVLQGGKPIIITNREGFRTTPSVVAYNNNGSLCVGQIAQHQSILNWQNTFHFPKRLIGDCNQKKQFTPEKIASEILRKLVEDASKYLGETITKAVVSVPSQFNLSQRQAIINAAEIAGIEVKRIINETTAASLAYGLDKKSNETILVFDLGGGTFDVSVLEVGDGVFEVLATSGDTHLGGNDFDKKIVDYIAEDFKVKEGIDLRKDQQTLQRLTEAAEKAKIELSSLSQVDINLPFITATQDGPKQVELSLTRAKFEEICSDLIERCAIPVENVLKDSKLAPIDIDEVVLVGGSTRIPAVKELVKKVLGKKPNLTVNPDEVVALGAAIRGGVLAGEVKDIFLFEATSLSLGVETLGGVMTTIIPRNTTTPTKKSKTFSTSADGQSYVDIHILEGDAKFAKDNHSLAVCRLDGISSAPHGETQIEVTFDIDARGFLDVTAKDKGTGKEQFFIITNTNQLSKTEIEKLVRNTPISVSNNSESSISNNSESSNQNKTLLGILIDFLLWLKA